jgi:cell division protein FtsB
MARRTTRKGETPGKRLLRRGGIVAGVIGGIWFLVDGGEWGTFDLMGQRKKYDKVQAEVAALEHHVDSLRAEHKAITTDNARIERIAREVHGMVRDKELLYWRTDKRDGDSTSAGNSAADSSAR